MAVDLIQPFVTEGLLQTQLISLRVFLPCPFMGFGVRHIVFPEELIERRDGFPVFLLTPWIGTQGDFGFTDFFNAKLKVPKYKEQNKIADVINLAEQECFNNEFQLQSLSKQKKALMQQLLTGKRRVKMHGMEVAKGVA